MEINEKIRMLREFNHFSQEEMAEKLNISTTGYAKIERGERGLNFAKLKKIAAVFDIEVADLVSINCKSAIYLINENSRYQNNNNYNLDEMIHEIDKLKLQLTHKNELILQKDNEIKMLQNVIETLSKK
ncbi:helix-turn-helix domain-containing protein [Neisseria flavescens]|jgi:ribonuclease T|uniref:helix-turn-helix domain-containing protein n=1 Tax=Neisseria flavescens TaxID=484 RepID=UPI0007A5743D|nr:helix-turn-helix transcriptional regulator [Neisseria flavescens]